MTNNPAQGPSTTPAPLPEYTFDQAKLANAQGTQEELTRFKVELGIDDTKKDGEHKEVVKVQEFFEREKTKIKKITRAELDKLKADIQDPNQDLPGELVIDQQGTVEYKEAQAAPSAAPTNAPAPAPATPPEKPANEKTKSYLERLSQKPQTETTASGIKKFIINILQGLVGTPLLGGMFQSMLLRLEGYRNIHEKHQTNDALSGIQSALNAKGMGKTANALNDISTSDKLRISTALMTYPEFYDNVSEMVDTEKVTWYFKKVLESGGIEDMKQSDIASTIVKMIEANDPSEIDYDTPLVNPAVAQPAAAPIPLTPEQEQKEEEKKRLNDLEEAQKADKEAADSSNPDQGKAMDTVKEIKIKEFLATEEIINKLKEDIQKLKDQKGVLEADKGGNHTEEIKKIDIQIQALENASTQIDTKIAEYIKNPTEQPNKWELKDDKNNALSAVEMRIAIQSIIQDSEKKHETKVAEKAKEIPGEKMKEEFLELKKQIDDTLYGDNKIDDMESADVLKIKELVKSFNEKYHDQHSELKLDLKVQDTFNKLGQAQAKYDLIRAFKAKERDMINSGGVINYDRTFGFGDWIEVANNGTIEIDIEHWASDATFLSKESGLIKKSIAEGGFDGSLQEAVNVLKDNKDILAKGKDGEFTGKKANSDGTPHLFKIQAAPSW